MRRNPLCKITLLVCGLLLQLPTSLHAQTRPNASPATQPTEIGSITFPAGQTKVEIPLLEACGELLVDHVKIDGRDAGLFILDTGCNRSTISPTAARSIGLTIDPVPGATACLANVKSISINGATLAARQVEVWDANGVSDFFGGKVAGFIGGDFLSACPFTIDSVNHKLTLYSRKSFVPPNQNRLPLMMELWDSFGSNPSYGTPSVTGTLNGLECKYEIDTGWANSLCVLSKFTSRHPELVDRGRGPYPAMFAGFNDGRGYSMHISRLEVLGQRFDLDSDVAADELAEGEEPPAMGHAEALLGRGVLRNLRLTFDYQAHSMWTERHPFPPVAEQLKMQGYSPNQRDVADWTPLMTAAAFGDMSDVEALLAAGSRADADEFHGKTILFFAAERNNPQIIQRLLKIPEAHAQVNTATASGKTPLMAAGESTEVTVAALLSAGADATTVDSDGETALHYAAMYGNVLAIPLLVAAHGDVNIFDRQDKAPLALAAENGNVALFDALNKCGATAAYRDSNMTVLHGAAAAGNFELVRHILDLPAAQVPGHPVIDAVCSEGTPLILACAYGRLKTATLLIERGADVNVAASGETKVTPLGKAAGFGHANLAKLLISHGALLEKPIAQGWSPLAAAVQYGDAETVRVLLDAGAKLDHRNDSGYTPLMIASQHGNAEAVRLLLSAGADPLAKANGETSAIFFAEQSGDPATKLLIVNAVKRATTQHATTQP